MCGDQLCAGSVRGKNAKNIILKNLLDTCFGAIGWYILGYGLAFGEDANDFLGEKNFGLHDVPPSLFHNWLFHYAVRSTHHGIFLISGRVYRHVTESSNHTSPPVLQCCLVFGRFGSSESPGSRLLYANWAVRFRMIFPSVHSLRRRQQPSCRVLLQRGPDSRHI